jgi:hypothetical protein
MRIGRGVRIAALAAATALGTTAASPGQAALTVTFNGQMSWTYPEAGTWDYLWSISVPLATLAETAVFDWSTGLPDGVTAGFTATKTPAAPGASPEPTVERTVTAFAYNLDPGGPCPFGLPNGSPLTAGPGPAVCAQLVLAPLPGDPQFGDAVNRVTARGMTLLDFVTDGDADWLSTLVLTYRDEAPEASYFAALSFRGTEITPGLVPADFTPPGGLPGDGFPVPPGGSVPPEFLPPDNGPPVAVPEPAALGLLGLGLLGLAAARRRAVR